MGPADESSHLRSPRSTVYIGDIECEVALKQSVKTGIACQVTLRRDSDSSAVPIKLGRMCIQGKLVQTMEEKRELMRALKDELKKEKALREELGHRLEMLERSSAEREEALNKEKALRKELGHCLEMLEMSSAEKEEALKIEKALREELGHRLELLEESSAEEEALNRKVVEVEDEHYTGHGTGKDLSLHDSALLFVDK